MGTTGFSTLTIVVALIPLILGSLVGAYFSRRLKMREDTLGELIQIIREMGLLIKHRSLPVDVILDEISRYGFIEEVRSNFTDGDNFRNGWEKATKTLLELNEDERMIINSVGTLLGTSDKEGQLSMLEVNAQLLETHRVEAHEDYLKKGKLYRSFGVLGGLFLSVVVL